MLNAVLYSLCMIAAPLTCKTCVLKGSKLSKQDREQYGGFSGGLAAPRRGILEKL